MTNFIRNFVRDDSGAAASEYILLLALLGGGVAIGAYNFGGSIKSAFSTKGTYLTNCASATGAAIATTC